MRSATNHILQVAVALIISVSGRAQFWSERQVTAPPDVTANGLFGWSVSMEGDLMLVGAPGSSDLEVQSGAAYLFQRNSGGENQWDLLRKLVPLGITAGARFGTSVLLKEGRAFVGAPLDIVNGVTLGALYIFDEDAGGTGSWGLTQRLFEPTGSLGMRFGENFSVGEILVVGAPDHVTTPFPGLPVPRGGVVAFASDELGYFSATDLFNRVGVGRSFALFGQHCYMSVGTFCAITPIDTMTMFDMDDYTPLPVLDTLWSTVSFGYPVLSSGLSLSASEDRLLATISTGVFRQVHSFVELEGEIEQEGAILPDTMLYDQENRFGESLGMDQDRTVVGAPGSAVGLPLGFAGVFDRDPQALGGWGTMIPLVPSDPDFGDLFGYDVSISNGRAAIGAPAKGSDDRGKVYVFEDPTVGVLEMTEGDRMLIGPVPSSDIVWIRFADHRSVRGIRVVDTQGKVHQENTLVGGFAELNVSSMSSGLYVVQLLPGSSGELPLSAPILITR